MLVCLDREQSSGRMPTTRARESSRQCQCEKGTHLSFHPFAPPGEIEEKIEKENVSLCRLRSFVRSFGFSKAGICLPCVSCRSPFTWHFLVFFFISRMSFRLSLNAIAKLHNQIVFHQFSHHSMKENGIR